MADDGKARSDMASGISAGSPTAFAHVAYGMGAKAWNDRWLSGSLLGINEPYAYGYHHAERLGWTVVYSEDHHETLVSKLIRGVLRVILGFDFLHAWRNRKGILAATAVWTHTESQTLAVAMVLALHGRRDIAFIGQSVWLMDRWPKLSALTRWLYVRLLARADYLTFHSPLNASRASQIFTRSKCEIVLFGICNDVMSPPRNPSDVRLRVLSLGNDRHRDWNSLLEAARENPTYDVTILTKQGLPRAQNMANVSVQRPTTNDELMAFYARADVVMVPLHPNLHASGITVIEEAVLQGVPVIASETGGLEAYFSPDEITYVTAGEPAAIVAALEKVKAEPQLFYEKAARAQLRMADEGPLNAKHFAAQHVRLSLSAMGRSKGQI